MADRITHDPQARLDYSRDWAAFLGLSGDGDTITASTWTVHPDDAGDGFTVTDGGHTDTTTRVWVEKGGALGSTYRVVNHATTAGGREADYTITVAVSDDDWPTELAWQMVEAFTGDVFRRSVRTVAARVGADGRAFLPHRLDATAPVTVARAGTTYPAGSYAVMSSATAGEVDAIGVGRPWSPTNMLILGLEPWANGWDAVPHVRVTATFGWNPIPSAVQQAVAILAAGFAPTAATPGGTASQADPEGNVIPVVPPFPDADSQQIDPTTSGRTTGNRQADALLVPYQRTRMFTAV